MNTLLNALKEETNIAFTENGAVSYASTLNPIVDFFVTAPASFKDTEKGVTLFKLAYAADRRMALRTQYQSIIIGNVSSLKRGMLTAQLHAKGQMAGRTVEVVNELYTSRACSACGGLSVPRGVNGSRVREWVCVDCGSVHDRDVNAARNILRSRYPTAVCGNELSPNAVAA